MQKTITRIQNNAYQDIKGTDLMIKLPITQEVIQRIFSDTVDADAFNWATVQVGPDNLLLFKVNMTVKVVFKTTFTLSLYIKLVETFEVKNAYTKVAEIYGVNNGLGFGKRKIMNKLRAAINENLPPYLKFQEDQFFLSLDTYFKTYEIPLREAFFRKIKISTDYLESRTEKEALTKNRFWLHSRLKI